MNVTEIIPIVSGLISGAFLGQIEFAHRKFAAVPLVLLQAILATILSGEFRLSWGFVLLDIPMVAIPTCISFYIFSRRRWSH